MTTNPAKGDKQMAESIPQDADSMEVRKLGYIPELPRSFGFFASFAIGFSFISVTAGVFGSFSLGLNTAGGAMPFGWLIIAAGQTLVALVFGTLATRVPLAGSSYQWVSRMTNPTLGWLQGWSFLTFVTISLLAVNYTLAQTIVPAVFGYTGTVESAVFVTACIALLQVAILLFSTSLAGRINNVAVITEIVGTVGLSLVLIAVVSAHHDFHLANIFTSEPNHPESHTSIGGLFHSGWWQMALVMGIYSLNGFEGAADMSEETSDAERHVPRAMWMAVVMSGLVGFIFIVALIASSQDLAAAAASPTPIADIVTAALGSGVAQIFLIIVAFSVFACGLIIFMDTTRIVYAMARDERLPGWKLLSRVNSKLSTPVFAVLAVGALDLVLAFTFGRSSDALNAIVGATSVLPPIMYGGPVIVALFRRNRLPESTAWSLGRWELSVTVAAAIFIVFEFFVLRDASLRNGWIYVAIMFGIGGAYLLIRRVMRGPLEPLHTKALTPTPTSAVADGGWESRN
jgi:amino acid transporter